MYTKLLFTTLLFFTFTICNAQHRVSKSDAAVPFTTTASEKNQNNKGGFLMSAGVNIANISGSDADNKAGLAISLGYTSNVNSGYIGTFTGHYIRGGYQSEFYDSNIKANLDYIGWQSKCLFELFDKFYIGFGLGMDILVSAKLSYEGDTMDIDDANIVDMNIPFNLRYYFGTERKVFLDASYNLGLFQVYGDDFLGDGCNRGFMFSLGVNM